ncbi:MAG: hypothetical protein BZ138_00495 [Methanosphaera sp. rholeuAM270]|nr:MAG: hypothetical protein BZ138_00495 [Methanosphaera sp. rholeuAM270]
MQRCSNCGEYNDEADDYCAYCGEIMFIQVDNNTTRTDVKMDHLYADSIAKELIDSNTNELLTDDMEEITRELLSDNSKDNILLDDPEYYFDTDEEEDKNKKLIQIEDELKQKIRRNKKLEANMGLLLRNIDVILDDFNGPLEIMGEITTNDKLDNKSVQLSAISYDENKHQLTKNENIINVDHGNFTSFDISLEIDVTKTAIIIIVPEMIQYDNTETIPTEKQESRPQEEKYEMSIEANNIFIEQLTEIERKIGLNVTNTSVIIKSDNEIEVVGEIGIRNPENARNIKIVATCYDEENHIIGTQKTQINTKLFLGFDTLSLKIGNIDIKRIQRIRLYPTLQ